jgi:3-isopropylmalate/(R)-2-methylmalate dehydratase large subunit
MGLTLTEKILAHRSHKNIVKPFQIIECDLDLVMGTDITVPLSIEVFNQINVSKVFSSDKIVLVHDHWVPARDSESATSQKIMREFAQKYNIKNYFEIGRSGICHTIVPDSGLVIPGDVVIGADSHTCTYGALGAFSTGVGSTDMAAAWALGKTYFKIPETIKIELTGKLQEFVFSKDIILHIISDIGFDGATYKALEFSGSLLANLSMSDRFTICNMVIECGAKNGIIPADDITKEFLSTRTNREFEILLPDPDSKYCEIKKYDVTNLTPQVALPYLPTNVKPVSKLDNISIDQVVIGSCTNGRFEDFYNAAKILKGKKVHKYTRLLIIPASQDVLKKLIEHKILEIFVDAGALICPPTCGPCLGGHMGLLGESEKGLYTTNRNFIGRCGPKSAEVYLASPVTAAATAIMGKITDPREFL